MSPRRLTLTLIVAAIAAAALAACGHQPPRAMPRTWELRGAVVDVTGDRLHVRHKSGQVAELTLDAATVIVHDEQPRGLEALRRGTRVRIVVQPLPDGGQRAETIRLYGGARE